jgi:adenylate cyclase
VTDPARQRSLSARKLAAIMFTDIVGYTSLMGQDEQSAIALLHKNRQIHEHCIRNHNGKLLKEMGDGILAQFNSALDAVQCALDIQKHAEDRVEGKLRIGIHLGDVIIEHDDVFGDGVNIASRLQTIADPGGIYVSESVQKAIRSRTDIQMLYLAEVGLKNVGYPVKTYSLQGHGLPVTPLSKIKDLSFTGSPRNKVLDSPYTYSSVVVLVIIAMAIWWWLPAAKKTEIRLAVLPTVDMSGEEDGVFIAAGLHAPIIDEIIKVSALQVISRTSSAIFGDAGSTIPEIATALKVDMVVESELTHMGDSVRLQFRLIEAFPEEVQIWSKAYNLPTADMLSIYGDVALEISRATNIDLTVEEISLLSNTKKVNPEAYKAYLTGRAHLFKLTSEGIDKALQYFNLSIEKDSTFAPAYMGIAFVWGARRQQGLIPLGEAVANIDRATLKANALDGRSTELETDSEIHFLMACANCWGKWRWEEAEKEFTIAIKLDSSNAEARAYYSHFLNIMQRRDEAEQQIDRAMELQPYSSLVQTLYGMYLNHTRQFDDAIVVLKNTLAEDPNYGMALAALWTNYHNKKMYQEAVETAKKVYSAKGEQRMLEILTKEYLEGGYKNAMERMAEAYIIKKDTSYVTPWQIATLYTRAANKDKALEWLERAYEEHDPNMPYISADPIFDEISADLRFLKILEDMNLPKPQ